MRQYEKDGLEALAKARQSNIDWFEVGLSIFVAAWIFIGITVLW
jgi:hypothetical protein